jgi:hypothetical protein
MRELISSSRAERESTQRVIRKRPHFRSLLDIFQQDMQQHLKENGDLPWSTVALPQIVSFHETSHQGMDEEDKMTEFIIGFKFISYT